jgi:drug/metabolite transporter (DMT)-like permease
MGTLAGLLSGLCYSSAVVWVRFAYQAGLNPGTAIFLRYAIASLALILFLVVSRRWTALPAVQTRQWFLLGLLAYSGTGIGWFTALSIMPSWLASLFVALFPLPIVVGSWLFLREPFDRRQLWALAAVVIGGGALFWRPLGGASLAGTLLMLSVIALNAVYTVAGRRCARGAPPLMTALWTTLGASTGAFGYAVVSRQFDLGFAPRGWLWAAMFAVVSTAAAIVLLWEGIARIGTARVAIIGGLKSLFSIVLSVLVLGESMTLLQGFGGTLMVAGVLLLQLPTIRLPSESPEG